MSKTARIAVLLALTAAVVAVFALKKGRTPPSAATAPATPAWTGLPRLVNLGSTTCVPCKLMAPVLDGLKQDYAGRLEVEFIDVGVNPPAARQYEIKLIPTQVFLDASGQEKWRHEGFCSKEEIVAKWKELGVDLAAQAATGPSSLVRPAVNSGAAGSAK